MSSNKFRLLAIGIMLLGAASSASTVSAGAGCCAKGAKSAGAASGAVLTSTAGGDHCASGAKGAKTAGECTYGETSVTMAGTCPAKNEANYSFYIAGVENRNAGTAAAQAIKSVKGVASVTVDYDKRMAYVCADGKTASKKAIEKSLKSAGYGEVKFVNASKQNCQKSHGKVEA
ncbi:MAG: heavy-metal-associated domain-containing protein [Candidatus Eisenbacteria bacterium]